MTTTRNDAPITKQQALEAIARKLSTLDPEDPCSVDDLKHDGRGKYEPETRVDRDSLIVVLNCATWRVVRASSSSNLVAVQIDDDEAETQEPFLCQTVLAFLNETLGSVFARPGIKYPTCLTTDVYLSRIFADGKCGRDCVNAIQEVSRVLLMLDSHPHVVNPILEGLAAHLLHSD